MVPHISRCPCYTIPYALSHYNTEAYFYSVITNRLAGSFDKKQKIVHLLIEDNGIGLGAEQQANFFLQHYTTKPSGSGLGTCFCQTIVKMHGGYVSVNGQPNIGCCVRIDLPLINRNHFTSNDYYNEVADTIF